MKCQCKHLLFGEQIYVHLSGCPETTEYKEYQQLRWYKKLFKRNPYNEYLKLFKV